MCSGADLQGTSPLVSFDHVTDPHFVACSSRLYTTIYNPKPNHNPNLNSNPDFDPDPNPNPNPNRNPIQWPLIRRWVLEIRKLPPFRIRLAPHFVVCQSKVPTSSV